MVDQSVWWERVTVRTEGESRMMLGFLTNQNMDIRERGSKFSLDI